MERSFAMIIRKAALKDAAGIAKVHVESWQTTYKGIIPNTYLQQLNEHNREKLWQRNIPEQIVYVAENNQRDIIGFSSGGMERSGKYPPYKGELYAVYILKEYQRRGIGQALLTPLVNELIARQLHAMVVIVLADNPSRFFYEKLGGERIDTLVTSIADKQLREVVYGWKDIHILKKIM